MEVYQKAWELFAQRIEGKPSWGKVELQRLMLQCMLDAGKALIEEKMGAVIQIKDKGVYEIERSQL